MTNGILTVYKEKDWTSHDVVAKVRRIFGQKKAGHTGTLDPQAEGVLPVCLGASTRVCALLTDQDKTYEALLRLGIKTDTQDMTGTVLRTCDVHADLQTITDAVSSFCGVYDQVPPMYSARKVNGRRLYDLAREGTQVERAPRRVWIREIEILSVDLPLIRLRVTCSKGTYIRTLCDDIGEKLGCGGAMESLLRTRVGTFTLRDAVTLRELEKAKDEGTLGEKVLSPDRLFTDLPAVRFTAQAAKSARNGNPIPAAFTDCVHPVQPATRVRMYDTDGMFYGISEADAAGTCFRPVKILTDLSLIRTDI